MGVDDTQPLISHLIELRKRLLNSIIAILVIFLALVYFANDIYQLVSAPLISKMPVGATMIATDVASPFFTPIKLTFMVSVILSVPIEAERFPCLPRASGGDPSCPFSGATM